MVRKTRKQETTQKKRRRDDNIESKTVASLYIYIYKLIKNNHIQCRKIKRHKTNSKKSLTLYLEWGNIAAN